MVASHKLLTKLWSQFHLCLFTEIEIAEGDDLLRKGENNLFENDIIEAWGYDSLEDDD